MLMATDADYLTAQVRLRLLLPPELNDVAHAAILPSRMSLP